MAEQFSTLLSLMLHCQSAVLAGDSYGLACCRRSQDDPVIAAFEGYLFACKLLDHSLQRCDSIRQGAGIPVSEGFIRQRTDDRYFGQLFRV
ncbi:hypothetical protein D3C75_1172910 [compost metagenome]